MHASAAVPDAIPSPVDLGDPGVCQAEAGTVALSSPNKPQSKKVVLMSLRKTLQFFGRALLLVLALAWIVSALAAQAACVVETGADENAIVGSSASEVCAAYADMIPGLCFAGPGYAG
jgi:hypothetical protein